MNSMDTIQGLILIDKNAQYAYCYAREIIGGRWETAESFIMKDPQWAYRYARDIMKGRWLEAEPYIRTNEDSWKQYLDWSGIAQ